MPYILVIEKIIDNFKGRPILNQKNLIQVYGLPRSGTNFVEWTLVNNFVDLKYKNIYLPSGDENIPPVVSSVRKGKIALKHSYPSLQYSKYAIVIYKEWDPFSISFKKWANRSCPIDQYEKYLNIAKSLDSKRCLFIEHSLAHNNYNSFVDKISEKFKVKKNNVIKKPLNRLNKAGALCKETNIRF